MTNYLMGARVSFCSLLPREIPKILSEVPLLPPLKDVRNFGESQHHLSDLY